MASVQVSESTIEIICNSLEKARNNLKVATKALSACYNNNFDLPEYVVLRTNITSNMHTFRNQKLPLLEVVNRKIIALAKYYYLPFDEWKAKLNEIALCAKSLNEDTTYTSQQFQEMLTVFKQREDECKHITKKLQKETDDLMREAEQKKSTADSVKWISFIPFFGLIGLAAGQIASSVIDNQANDLKNKSIVMAAIAKAIEEDLIKAVSNVVGCLSEIAGCVSIIETDVRLLSSKTEAIYDNVKLPHYKILNARAKRLDESCSSFNSYVVILKSPSTIPSGNQLVTDGLMCSDNEFFTAIMQADGNFVIYENGQPIWASNTCGVGVGPHKVVMQDDGNLVIYDKNNNPTWASNTCGVGEGPFRVTMQDDRNLVIYDKHNRATWASGTCNSEVLYTNVELRNEKSICSSDKRFRAVMQGDGNFVIYNEGNQAVWASNTNGKGVGPYRLIMQSDGNLVIYDKDNRPTWASNTDGHGTFPYRLVMQNDRNLVIYDVNGHPTWASNTNI